MTYFIQDYHSGNLGGCLGWIRETDKLRCLRGHKLPTVLPYSVGSGLFNPWRQREMMKRKRDIKVCSNSPKEKENLVKVEPGSGFREQEFNCSFCHCVFLIRATVGAGAFPSSHREKDRSAPGTGHQSGLTLIQSPIQSGKASLHHWLKKRRKGAVYSEMGDTSQTIAVVLSSSRSLTNSNIWKQARGWKNTWT